MTWNSPPVSPLSALLLGSWLAPPRATPALRLARPDEAEVERLLAGERYRRAVREGGEAGARAVVREAVEAWERWLRGLEADR
jgi:hypothetical protein